MLIIIVIHPEIQIDIQTPRKENQEDHSQDLDHHHQVQREQEQDPGQDHPLHLLPSHKLILNLCNQNPNGHLSRKPRDQLLQKEVKQYLHQ